MTAARGAAGMLLILGRGGKERIGPLSTAAGGALGESLDSGAAHAQARDRLTQAEIEEEFGDLLFAVVNLARHLDVDAHDGLEQHRVGDNGGVLERHRTGHLEGHLRGVDLVVRTVEQGRLNIDHRVAGDHAVGDLLLDTLVDRVDVLARNHAAHDIVDELVFATRLQRLQADDHVAQAIEDVQQRSGLLLGQLDQAAGHAVGVAMLALLFGVRTAFLAYSLVLLLQALLFGAGGITALPINALAIGLVGGVCAVSGFRLLQQWRMEVGIVLGAVLSVLVPGLIIALVLVSVLLTPFNSLVGLNLFGMPQATLEGGVGDPAAMMLAAAGSTSSVYSTSAGGLSVNYTVTDGVTTEPVVPENVSGSIQMQSNGNGVWYSVDGTGASEGAQGIFGRPLLPVVKPFELQEVAARLKVLSGRGQPNAPVVSFEQDHAQFVFQPPDTAAERRRTHVARFARPAEMQAFRQVDDLFQNAVIHFLIVAQIGM